MIGVNTFQSHHFRSIDQPLPRQLSRSYSSIENSFELNCSETSVVHLLAIPGVPVLVYVDFTSSPSLSTEGTLPLAVTIGRLYRNLGAGYRVAPYVLIRVRNHIRFI